MDIIKSIEHRMGLIEQTHKELRDQDRDSVWDTDKLNTKISSELNLFKIETKSILKECEDIKKAVFHLGGTLREKVSKHDLDLFQTTINEWPLEDFLTHKELYPAFNKYSKH